jgi:NAD(P)-dependent dehydrogenase (short-subunit alcohol dehydrogenase family)
MQGLKDKVFIVTGGGSGIGAATVSRLLAEGARVAAAGTRLEGLARTRAAVGAAADNLLTVRFDLRDEDSIGSLVAQTVDGFGRLDGVANVAAGVVPGLIDRDDGASGFAEPCRGGGDIDNRSAAGRDDGRKALSDHQPGADQVDSEHLGPQVDIQVSDTVSMSSSAAWRSRLGSVWSPSSTNR